MWALGMRAVGEPELLEVDDASAPQPGEVRVAMEMVALGIAEMRACRGDRFRHFKQTVDPASPFVFGFAGVGRVVESADPALRDGQRVVLSGLDACGRCTYCRAGQENHCPDLKLSGIDVHSAGFARDFVTLPARRVFPLPEEFGSARACVVSEVATAIHALKQGRLARGESIAVVGAGRHGRQIISVARRLGASLIVAVDPQPAARDLAIAVGAHIAVDPGAPIAQQVDVVVHANSEEVSLDLCCDLVRQQGRVVLLGTPRELDVSLPRFTERVVRGELELIATDSKNPDEYRAAIEMMASGTEDWEVRNPLYITLQETPAILRRAKTQWPLERDMFIAMKPVVAGGVEATRDASVVGGLGAAREASVGGGIGAGSEASVVGGVEAPRGASVVGGAGAASEASSVSGVEAAREASVFGVVRAARAPPVVGATQPNPVANVVDAGLVASIPAIAAAVRVVRQSKMEAGDIVAVFGLGTAGLLAIQVARAYGARTIHAIDPVTATHAAARKRGAQEALSMENYGRWIRDHSADAPRRILLLTSSPDAFETAVRVVGQMGVIVACGDVNVDSVLIPDYYLNMIMKETAIVGAEGASEADRTEAVRLVETGAIRLPPSATP